jgi:hypothetical protein
MKYLSLGSLELKTNTVEMFILPVVPDTASYIRGWIQMVLAPNDLFSWNNKYNKYNNYTFTDTFTCFSLSYAHKLTLCMLASRSHAGVVILGLLSSSHVFSLPLSGLNWRPLFPPWGSSPSFPNMAAPFTGSAHTPSPGSGTVTVPYHVGGRRK